MMWWPATGISMTGATRPSRSYRTSPCCGETRPCSARNSATRQSSLVSSSGVRWSRAKTRGSNFHVQPPSAGADRGGGDVIRDVVQRRLVGNRAEAGDGRLAGRIDAQRAERPVLARRPVLGGHVPDRGVDGDRPGDLRPGQGGEPQRDQAAHAVPDDHRRGGEARRRPRPRAPRGPTCRGCSGPAGRCRRARTGPRRPPASPSVSSGAMWSHQREWAAPPWTSTMLRPSGSPQAR